MSVLSQDEIMIELHFIDLNFVWEVYLEISYLEAMGNICAQMSRLRRKRSSAAQFAKLRRLEEGERCLKTALRRVQRYCLGLRQRRSIIKFQLHRRMTPFSTPLRETNQYQ
jgi:hypothetical protein